MERLLLHHCCAPCSPKIVESLRKDYSLTGFWFNPNIHPAEELSLREASLARFALDAGITLEQGPSVSRDDWLARAPREKPDRCRFCYTVRMRETARRAKELGIPYFSTTLFASPFQEHELVREAASAASREHGVSAVYRDCRPLYFEGKTAARNAGYYLQKYCGCIYSREERAAEKAARKAAR